MPSLSGLTSGAGRVVALSLVGLLVIGAAVFLLRPGTEDKILKASFPRTVSIYEGSDVRILGVPVGQVDTVTPAGTTVEVQMSYDPEIDVPADAKAVVIAPSVVGDRYVQLTPVYTEGEKLEDGATLDMSSTAVPLELDEIYRLFARLLEQGAGIILISSYLPEVYELADRLHVFRQGKLVASHGYRGGSHEDVLTQAIGV